MPNVCTRLLCIRGGWPPSCLELTLHIPLQTRKQRTYKPKFDHSLSTLSTSLLKHSSPTDKMASGLWQPAPVKAEATIASQMGNVVPGTWLTLTSATLNATSPTLEPEQASPVDGSLFLSNSAPSATSSRHSSFNASQSPMRKCSPFHGPDAAERRASNVEMGRAAAFLCNNSH